MNTYRSWPKRLIDILVSVGALVLLSPVLALVAFVVRSRFGSPILFTQIRPGLRGVPFKIFKFRTMHDRRSPSGGLLPDAARLDSVGRFLRATSLDELPELWNVLKGDMSLVGPRPLLMQYLDRYTLEQKRRHDVRPGITGLAQVSGRNALEWDRKFELDLQYVDRCCLSLDLKILWQTVAAVVKRDGISQDGHATAPEFAGPKA
jgi:sugar transferase EpsL